MSRVRIAMRAASMVPDDPTIGAVRHRNRRALTVTVVTRVVRRGLLSDVAPAARLGLTHPMALAVRNALRIGAAPAGRLVLIVIGAVPAVRRASPTAAGQGGRLVLIVIGAARVVRRASPTVAGPEVRLGLIGGRAVRRRASIAGVVLVVHRAPPATGARPCTNRGSTADVILADRRVLTATAAAQVVRLLSVEIAAAPIGCSIMIGFEVVLEIPVHN